MVKTLFILLLMATLGVAIVFAVSNFIPVPFNYLFGIAEVSLSSLVIGAFIVGVLFGYALDVLLLYRQRARIRQLEKKIKATGLEINNLRKMPLKDLPND